MIPTAVTLLKLPVAAVFY